MKQLLIQLQLWRVLLIASSVIMLCSSLLIQPVYAITQNDLNSIFLNTPFYDPTASRCINTSGTSVLTGSDNQEKAFNYFIIQGLNTVQTAAILGNLMEESGVNPNRVQSDGPGNGIAQWSSGGRWDATSPDGGYKQDTVYGFAHGRDVHDLAVQLDFIWWEISEGPYTKVLDGLKKFTKSTDLDKATEFWMLKYESPDPTVAHLDVRQSDAQGAYVNYDGSIASSADALCSSSNFATNFVIYKQCSNYGQTPTERTAAATWEQIQFGSSKDSTICHSGCGPAAMAMIITNLTGQRVTPDATAKVAAQSGDLANGGAAGTFASLNGPHGGGLPADISAHWKLVSTPIQGFSISSINQVLMRGGLVLALGNMDNAKDYKQGPFTQYPGGHFVVIRARTASGQWLIGNSGGWPDDRSYDPDWLYTHTVMHDAWAITRN